MVVLGEMRLTFPRWNGQSCFLWGAGVGQISAGRPSPLMVFAREIHLNRAFEVEARGEGEQFSTPRPGSRLRNASGCGQLERCRNSPVCRVAVFCLIQEGCSLHDSIQDEGVSGFRACFRLNPLGHSACQAGDPGGGSRGRLIDTAQFAFGDREPE